MNNFIYFITMLMATILVLLMIGNLYGCAFMVAKETARAITIVAEDNKAKSEHKKKNEEHKDEKQNIIDCIKMVVVCD